jgi:hypothetical protein
LTSSVASPASAPRLSTREPRWARQPRDSIPRSSDSSTRPPRRSRALAVRDSRGAGGDTDARALAHAHRAPVRVEHLRETSASAGMFFRRVPSLLPPRPPNASGRGSRAGRRGDCAARSPWRGASGKHGAHRSTWCFRQYLATCP